MYIALFGVNICVMTYGTTVLSGEFKGGGEGLVILPSFFLLYHIYHGYLFLKLPLHCPIKLDFLK